MKLLPFLAALLCLEAVAHTLVLVRANRMAEANALATSVAFGFNGDGGDAFVTILYPAGDTNATLTNCWTWTAATFTPARRAALSQLVAAPQWNEDVLIWDYDSADGGFPFRVLQTNNLAPAPVNLFPQP